MMKLPFFAAALLLGTAAIAQSNDPAMTPPDATPAPDASMPPPAGTDQSMPTPPPADPSTPPADASMTPPAATPPADAAPAPSTTDYPVCSKTVKDKCVNPADAHHMHKPK